jgi:uncharacterized protein YdhG (YjbR/CyaY superfamily)
LTGAGLNTKTAIKKEHMEAVPKTKYATVDEYLSALPSSTKALMQEVRNTIKKAAPEAEELISYNMPAFRLNGMLVWYAAYKGHIGFYPKNSGITAFKKELSGYKGAKGSVQFPLNKPMPLDLIRKIVSFRVQENLERPKSR